MKKYVNLSLVFALVLSIFVPVNETEEKVHATTNNSVVINEVAWMGTSYSYTDEWIELHNNTTKAWT